MNVGGNARLRDLPAAASIEIFEAGKGTDETAAGSVIVPTEVRINGMPVLIPSGGIRIHEMQLGDPLEPVLVTLTLYARRVVIAAEDDL